MPLEASAGRPGRAEEAHPGHGGRICGLEGAPLDSSSWGNVWARPCR